MRISVMAKQRDVCASTYLSESARWLLLVGVNDDSSDLLSSIDVAGR